MDLFRFNMGVDVLKSEQDTDKKRLIRGYASTQDKDRQGDSLLQKGLEIEDFVNHGYFNYDHNNSIILGYPLATCEVNQNGFYVEGELLKGIPEADRIWELAQALKKSNAPRRLGFSVEGKILERNNGIVTKAKIYNVAITTNPVNTNCTWDILAKSFASPEAESLLSKSLYAGYEVNPELMQGGEVFREESLEDSLKNLSYVLSDVDKKKKLKEQLSMRKSFSRDELVLYVQLTEGYSRRGAEKFVSLLEKQ